MLEGKADEVKMKQRSKERQAILDLLKEHPQGLSAQAVAEQRAGFDWHVLRPRSKKGGAEQWTGEVFSSVLASSLN